MTSTRAMATGEQRDKPYLESLYHEIEAGYYDRVYRRGRGTQWFWHEHRFRTVAALLPQPCHRILDLGCGPGTFLGNLGSAFRYGLGIDLATTQIEYAQRTYSRPNLEFRAADVRDFVGGEPFDAVVSIEVIEHLPPAETQPFLRTLHYLLKPGGTVILTTPNYRSLWPMIERLVSRIGPVDYTRQHINPFTVARLEEEVAKAGFRNIQSETFFILAPFMAALSGSIARAALQGERALFPGLGSEIALRAQRAQP
jgi:2-polyprenyl-3-methyl-5-hydroxy-6-metoxy-1,4-benzoquinol methylase